MQSYTTAVCALVPVQKPALIKPPVSTTRLCMNNDCLFTQNINEMETVNIFMLEIHTATSSRTTNWPVGCNSKLGLQGKAIEIRGPRLREPWGWGSFRILYRTSRRTSGRGVKACRRNGRHEVIGNRLFHKTAVFFACHYLAQECVALMEDESYRQSA